LARLPRAIAEHDATIIDMPGALTAGSHNALQAADLVLVVTGDRQFELNALEMSVSMAKSSGSRTVLLLNRVHPFTDATGIIEVLESLDVEVCPVVVRERSPHYKALTQGLTAAEFEPDGAAAAEIARLWQWLEGQA
jgi:chromosome partitioning protein